MDYNTQNSTQSSTQNKNSNNQAEPLLPWEQNEKEKEELKQSFLSKYWMLLVLIILLAMLPFTILKINFGKAQQTSNSTVNSNSKVSSNSQQISGPYLNNQEFDSLFNTTNSKVLHYSGGYHFLVISNNSFSTETKITNNTTNNTYGDSLNSATDNYPFYFLSNNITEDLSYIDAKNITTSSNKTEAVIGVIGNTYKTPKPLYIYSTFFSQNFLLAPYIDNKTYNGMEYSISDLTEPKKYNSTTPQTYNSGKNSSTYNLTYITFLGVKNTNVYYLNFLIYNYGNIKNITPNITKLTSIVSNFS